MKKTVGIIILLSLISLSGQTQVWKTIKKAVQEESKKYIKKKAEELKDTAVQRIENWSNAYDATEYNYAVSFSDNSGFYEAEDKFEKNKRSLIGFAVKPGTVGEKLSDKALELKPEDYNNAGEFFYASNKFRSAELSFNAALALLASEGRINSETGALVKSNLGLLYHTTGRFTLSEEFTLEALKMRKDILNDQAGYGASQNNLAVLFKDLGRYNEAEGHILEAVEITRETMGRESSALAIVLNNQAILYQVLGNYKEAERILKEAIEIAGFQLREKSPNFVRLKVNLALLYQLQKRYDDAEEIYLEAIRIKKNRLGTNHPDYAVMLRNVASLYQLKGDYSRVEENLKEAIDIYRKKFGEQHHVYAAAIYDLGKFYQFMEDIRNARPLISEAIQIQRNSLGEHHPSLTESREAMAVLEWQEGKLDQAAGSYIEVLDEYLYQINTYFPCLSDNDKSRFWEKIHPKFMRFYSFALDAGKDVPEIKGKIYNYHIATKALLLSASNKVKYEILNSGDDELVKKYNEWIDLKEYLARLYTLSKEELAADKINLDSLETEANLKEKELSRASEVFNAGYKMETIGYREISEKLDEGEACIEIIRFPKYNFLAPDTLIYYSALKIDQNKNNLPELVTFKNGKQLETNHAKRYRTAMQRGFEGEAFYDIYWKKLGDITSGIRRLYVSVDGIYNQINLNTLQMASGKFLIDEKDIFYVTNTKDVIGIKDRISGSVSTDKGAVLLGDPDYDKDFDWQQMKQLTLPELPGTKIEVEKIKTQLLNKSWLVDVYLQEDASEENLKKVKNPYLLHIATHGFFLEDLKPGRQEKIFGIEPMKASENPLLRSGLMLTGADNTVQNINTTESRSTDDGILNAYEAMILDLDYTELVVLSACETGLGEIRNGEGVYGLQRAFQIAGTSSVMISLWQVSDEVTQKLMTNFYKYWLETGNKHMAFTRSQLDIKEIYTAPFYWGAFIMVNK
jgi:CHAT domain-containing protein